MVDSINTNAGSLLGIRSLQKTNSTLGATQKEIATGKDVNSVKDNAAILAISQLLESDIAGLGSVKNSLDRAISTTDVALAAGSSISDLLLQAKEKAVQAADPGIDEASRSALNQDFSAIKDQITSIVGTAEFNGTNAIKADGDDIVAVTGADGSGDITIDAQDLSLGGENITLTESQGIGSAADALAAVEALDDSLNNLTSALSELGSAAGQLQQTKDFTEALSNSTEVGIGNLVDANLASSSANLQANQVKQALGIQSLSIANQQPAAVLGLFQT